MKRTVITSCGRCGRQLAEWHLGDDQTSVAWTPPTPQRCWSCSDREYVETIDAAKAAEVA